MRKIYYNELTDFVNLENINFQGNVIRKGKQLLDETIYDKTHGLIQSHLTSLKDIANLGDNVLKYPLGSGVEMMLFNIMMIGKGVLVNQDKHAEIITNSNSKHNFSVTLVIKENFNNFTKITISTDRSLTVIGELSKESELSLETIKQRFEPLSKIHI